ncbi:MAG: hypothetical protein KF802_03095 [Bdellovibrionaceae bacterium]|nr:hypothetical protein [Pseudobdellovibrionaceae bacterium]MBX3033393.1 hypothetical protein [Pseudobdellovibrionaceae bacterium]
MYHQDVSDEVQDYLQYVKDVLGVNQVIQPRATDQPERELTPVAHTRTGHWPPPQEFDLLVLHAGEGALFQGETAELWDKMKGAMNLGSRRVLEIETAREDLEGVLLQVLETYPAAVSLILSPAPNRRPELHVLGPSKVLESFSPQNLLQAPDLKRTAWGDLQIVMRSLGASAAPSRKN